MESNIFLFFLALLKSVVVGFFLFFSPPAVYSVMFQADNHQETGSAETSLCRLSIESATVGIERVNMVLNVHTNRGGGWDGGGGRGRLYIPIATLSPPE